MLKIIKFNNKLILEYVPYRNEDWIIKKFNQNEPVLINNIFNFDKNNLLYEIDDNFEYQFLLGKLENEYYKIDKDILDLKYDLLLYKDLRITIRTFRAEKKISIFNKIDSITKEQIIIGGDNEKALPIKEFDKIIHDFPTATELKYYANSKISNILKNYFDTISDEQKKLDKYLNKRQLLETKLSTNLLIEYEKNKYIFIKELLEDMLINSNKYVEKDWQKQIIEIILLIYPKYIKVLENINIKDYYTNSEKVTNRYIDLMLIDINGNADIIEIKRPLENNILDNSRYRDNFIPNKILSGTIMQMEKYLFHLNKWGRNGEVSLNKRRKDELPENLSIKITNPKGIVILGRDNLFTCEQKMDFEIIKRKYTNVVDIITYDDLLLRVENIIAKFT